MSQNPLGSYHSISIFKTELDLIQGHNYLNDSLINIYYEYLLNEVEEIEHPKTFFVAPCTTMILRYESVSEYVEQVLSDLKLDEYDIIFVPVNDNPDVTVAGGGSHWSLLVYSKSTECFYYFDSLHEYNYETATDLKTKIEVGLKHGLIPIKSVKCSQQTNGYDCGVYVLKFIELIFNSFKENRQMEEIDFLSVKASDISDLRVKIFNILCNIINTN